MDYDLTKRVLAAHIFEDGELTEEAVVRFFRTTALDGKQYDVAHYNHA